MILLAVLSFRWIGGVVAVVVAHFVDLWSGGVDSACSVSSDDIHGRPPAWTPAGLAGWGRLLPAVACS
jgi:hypothetical protein